MRRREEWAEVSVVVVVGVIHVVEAGPRWGWAGSPKAELDCLS